MIKQRIEPPLNLKDIGYKVNPIEADDYSFILEREKYFNQVESEGKVIKIPERHQLQIDIDSEEQASIFKTNINIIRRYYDFTITEVRNSPSGGLHIYIDTPFDMDAAERIAWQAALGSDPIRELLSLVRMSNNIMYPTLLVEPKKEEDLPEPVEELF